MSEEEQDSDMDWDVNSERKKKRRKKTVGKKPEGKKSKKTPESKIALQKKRKEARQETKKKVDALRVLPISKTTVEEVPDVLNNLNWREVSNKYISHGFHWERRIQSMLREKLLQHKWGDAALIMEGLSLYDPNAKLEVRDIYWKVGNELLYNHPGSKKEKDLVLKHYQTTKTHSMCRNRLHVLYEYVLYLLVQKDFKNARDFLKFYHSVPREIGQYYLKPEVGEWAPVMEGYLGLLEYITWHQLMKIPGYCSTYPGDENEENILEATAEEAVQHFEHVLSAPGIYDIFVVKLVEILESLGRYGEAEDALRSYSSKNMENPNAHKYLYQFLARHPRMKDSEASRIEALSNLHAVAPSDKLMIELHCLRMNVAFQKQATDPGAFATMAGLGLEILMDMLDYDTWINDETAWTCLAENLSKVNDSLNKSEFDKIVDLIWRITKRASWWPKYHFTKFKAETAIKIDTKLATSKSTVASILVGDRCEFCTNVDNSIKGSLQL